MNAYFALLRRVAPWVALTTLFGSLSVEVDEPQFASGYSRIAFFLGLTVIASALILILSALWALIARLTSRT